jgi:hypothetical protein
MLQNDSNAILRNFLELPQKNDHFGFVETLQFEWIFSTISTKLIIFLKTTTQYLSKTLSVVKIG